jgi:phage-related protein
MKKIKLYGGYFEWFKATLSPEVVKKLDYIISLLETSDRIPSKFIGYIREGLYELRMEYESNIYRVFFIFDKGNIVILFNGFQKKTQKTPENEIIKALKIKHEYYADQQPSNN